MRSSSRFLALYIAAISVAVAAACDEAAETRSTNGTNQVHASLSGTNHDKLLQKIRTLMTSGRGAASAELLRVEKSEAGFGVPVYRVRYPSPSMSSAVHSDLGRRGIITRELFEDQIVVVFEYVDDIMIKSSGGDQLPLNFFDIPGRISIHEYEKPTASLGQQLDRYTFIGDSVADLRYRSDLHGEMKIARSFFDRVPIPNR